MNTKMHGYAEKKAKLEFVPPKSMDEAEQERSDLLKATKDIELQLGAWQDTGDEARRWRQTAIYAREKLSEKYRVLKRWMHGTRMRVEAEGVGLCVEDTGSVVRASYQLLKKWARDRVEVVPAEQGVISALELWMNENP